MHIYKGTEDERVVRVVDLVRHKSSYILNLQVNKMRNALKIGLGVIALLSFYAFGTAAIASVPGMDSKSELEARAQIEDTLNRYTYGLDKHDAKQYASAFTTDGILWFKENQLKGHEAIMGFIINAKPTQPMYHLRLNSLIEFLGRDNARVTSYFVTIYGDTSTGFKVGLMGTYNDVFVKERGNWLIKERKPAIFGPDPDQLKKEGNGQ